jgi:WD40 repeat protein
VPAAAGQSGTVFLWDLDGGARRTRGRHKNAVIQLAFHADGRRLITAGKDDVVHIWDAEGDGEPEALQPGKDVRAFALDRPGRLLAVVADKTLVLFDWESRKQEHTIKMDMPPVSCVAVHPNGQLIALGLQDRHLQMVEYKKDGGYWQFRGHASGVTAMAFAGDGGLLASASYDRTVKLWQPYGPYEQEPVSLRGHTREATCVTFSPDGRRLASGGADRTVRLWRSDASPEYQLLGEAFMNAVAVAVSPDGRRGASASWHLGQVSASESITEGEVLLWDLAGGPGQVPLKLHGHEGDLTGVTFAPDGKELATSGQDGKATLWDPRDGTQRRRLDAHKGAVRGLAYLPGGRLLTAGEDHKIKVWDAARGAELYAFDDPGGAVSAAAVSPDGRFLATAADRRVRLWDLETRTVLRTLEGPTADVRALAFSPDGLTLAAGGDDEAVRVWERETGKLAHELTGHSGSVRALAFHPRQPRLASAGGGVLQPGEIKLWDTASGQDVLTLRNRLGPFSGIAFSPDGVRLLSVDAGSFQSMGEVRVWSAAPPPEPAPPRRPSMRLRKALDGQHGAAVLGVALAPGGASLATTDGDGWLCLWDLKNGKPTPSRKAHPEGAWGAVYLSEEVLATGGSDGKIKLWDGRTGKPQSERDLGQPVQSLAASADRALLAAGGNEGAVALWDAGKAEARSRFSFPRGQVIALAFAPDGKTLAACNVYGQIKVCEVDSGKELRTITTYERSILAMALAPGGRVLAVSCNPRGEKAKDEVRLYDLGSGKELATVPTLAPVRGLAFTPDAAWLAAGAHDGMVYLIDLSTRKLAASVKAHDKSVLAVRISPDGRTLITTSADQTARLWDLKASP